MIKLRKDDQLLGSVGRVCGENRMPESINDVCKHIAISCCKVTALLGDVPSESVQIVH